MAQTPSQANAAEIENWNEVVGRSWAMLHERLDRQIAPIGRVAMARAGFAAGQRVLDIGCGCGETSFEIAGKVSPGRVDGVDISAMLLEIARTDAAAKGLSNISFTQADAQVHAMPPAAYDVVFSRFGVMFFDDPTAAFANISPALKPSGRLAFCCWRAPTENLWMALPMQAVRHLLPPLPPADPNAPGPFAFADAERVRRILADAGFTGIEIEPLDLVTGTDSLDESVLLALRIGQLGSALRQIGPDDALKAKVEGALREAMARHLEDGVVKLPAAAWIVSARA